jgi:uncharacterized protein YfaS (alpha-2-macroglobulin family)
MKLKYIIIPALIIAIGAVAFSKILNLKSWDTINYQAGKPYQKEWKQIDSIIQLGQPESALKAIDALYEKSKAEKNYAQLVKAIIYKTNQNVYEENSEENNIAFIEAELGSIPFPSKPLLQSILAEKYWQYYQNHRYQILQRTVTVDFKNDDIKTWDAEKFALKVSQLYKLSLSNDDSLKRVDLTLMDSVLVRGAGSKNLRPTLYDFLAHRALDFFMNDESGITKPSNLFKINDANVFSEARKFIALRVDATDTLSHDYQALVLFRQITAFRLEDKDVNALVDLELERLQFMKRKAVVTNKDSLYVNALLQLENDYKNDTISARTGYEIAQEYYNSGAKKADNENEEDDSYIKALAKCEDVIKRFPKTLGANNCEVLKGQILQPSLSLQVEMVNVPGKAFLSLVNYKNIKNLHLKIIKADEQLNKLNDRHEQKKFIEELNKRKPHTVWQQALPETKDYRNHSTEIKLNELPFGKYYVVASAGKDFNGETHAVAYTRFWISDLSFITKNNREGSLEIYVLNRTSGHGISGAEVKVYREQYNYNSREYDYKLKGTYKTNNEGYLIIEGSGSSYENFKLEIIHKDDKLDLRDYFYASRYNEYDNKNTRAFLFTDRAIYRPGQTVFFKGLLLESSSKENKIKPGQTVNVSLRDVNYQIVKEQKFTTNEYGTFNGNFMLPSSGLNGNFTLLVENFGSKNFRVEDYKRPKFLVKFEPVKGSFRVNELVEVKGNAKMYAGSNVDDAKVQYRVVRNARYPIWCGWWWRERFPSSPEQEIISGETKTDAEGNFTISFTAVPDESLDKKNQPIFTYTVYADVTDITGETRSDEVRASVGYVALEADLDFKETYLNNEATRVKIITQNLNGEFEAAEGTVTIHQLTAPDKLVRKKLWSQPSQYFINEQDFEKEFPLDEYKPKNNFSEWAKGKEVLRREFDTEKEKELVLKELVNWQQGAYKAELITRDKFGNVVKAEKYFTVISAQNKQMPYPKYDYFYAEKTVCEPGESAKLYLGSSAKDVKVLYEITHNNKVISKKWLTLNNDKTLIEIPVEEKHRGNFAVSFAFVRDNRIYFHTRIITVPYTNKELKVEWETFRDKLAPGQKEQWKLKLSGPKGEKVAAELLAGMYDASLDAFVANYWDFSIWNSYSGSYSNLWSINHGFRVEHSTVFLQNNNKEQKSYRFQDYDMLNWFNGGYGYAYRNGLRYKGARGGNAYRFDSGDTDGVPMMAAEMAMEESEVTTKLSGKVSADKAIADEKNATGTKDPITLESHDNLIPVLEYNQSEIDNISPRTNLQETAFFFPNLETDEEGNVVINFTIPEALTKWKFMGFAHTKELQSVLFNKETVTQKDLMVFPNAPRFLREGDRIIFTAKVSNLSEKELSGKAKLTLLDALTLKPINDVLGNTKAEIDFTAAKGQSAALSWNLSIPQGIEAVTYRITAAAGNFTDGEESTLPVLTNRMLVTETLPLWIKSNQTKTFKLDKLLQSGKGSSTLQNQRLTLEFTSQPAWYAIQALPYLMEYPYDCAEQTFNRLYANALATHIVNSAPKVKAVFDRWKNTDALVSNLSKNQELKSLLLEETPWVMDAQNETEQKKRVALLFDLNTMSNQKESTINKLEKMQLPNGGFPWFSGMRDNEYITLYILTGLGKLDKLNVIQLEENNRYNKMALKATRYCDDRMKEDYEDLKKWKVKMDEQHIGYMQIQYLYARSFMNKYVAVPSSHQEAYNYYMQQAEKYWNKQNQYMKGMMALALHRAGNTKTPPLIMRSLDETSVKNEELGMYWKDLASGYYWYQAPIETQALMIEAFNEVAKNENAVDELRVWLLKNKQTNAWSNSKSTSDACYSLLLSGTNWLSNDALVDISVGTQKIVSNGNLLLNDIKAEAGTGYFKTAWDKTEIKPDMGNITLSKKDKGVSWGALYWQYFEQLDKITPAATPLQLKKQLFLQQNTSGGPRITPVTASTKLQRGDLIKVRIELRVDRDMEFVHMKDMRASGFEPTNVLSQYKYQGGLGYYESTRDAATNFFFDYLPKGTYVFEYTLRISHKGDFSNGITTIQSMYAPEFASHSEGVRVKVE